MATDPDPTRTIPDPTPTDPDPMNLDPTTLVPDPTTIDPNPTTMDPDPMTMDPESRSNDKLSLIMEPDPTTDRGQNTCDAALICNFDICASDISHQTLPTQKSVPWNLL